MEISKVMDFRRKKENKVEFQEEDSAKEQAQRLNSRLLRVENMLEQMLFGLNCAPPSHNEADSTIQAERRRSALQRPHVS